MIGANFEFICPEGDTFVPQFTFWELIYPAQGWHPKNPALGIYPKNPGGIFGINGPGIKGIFGIFGINGQIAKKNHCFASSDGFC